MDNLHKSGCYACKELSQPRAEATSPTSPKRGGATGVKRASVDAVVDERGKDIIELVWHSCKEYIAHRLFVTAHSKKSGLLRTR
jgi:hypothetical protein